MHIPIHITVYLIPGGEGDSQQAFDELESLLEAHPTLSVSVYRGKNRANEQWIVTLIGEPDAFARYREQLEQPLQAVQAVPLQVPAEALMPLLDRYLARQEEMRATRTPFLVKHFPLSKADYAKRKTASQHSTAQHKGRKKKKR